MKILLYSNDLEEQDFIDKLFVYLYQFLAQERTVQWITQTELDLLPSEEASKNINLKLLEHLKIYYVERKFRSEISQILSDLWIPVDVDEEEDKTEEEEGEQEHNEDEDNEKLDIENNGFEDNIIVKVEEKEETKEDEESETEEEVIVEPPVVYLFVDLSASSESFIEKMLPTLHEIDGEMKKLNPESEVLTTFSDALYDDDDLENFENIWNVQFHKL